MVNFNLKSGKCNDTGCQIICECQPRRGGKLLNEISCNNITECGSNGI